MWFKVRWSFYHKFLSQSSRAETGVLVYFLYINRRQLCALKFWEWSISWSVCNTATSVYTNKYPSSRDLRMKISSTRVYFTGFGDCVLSSLKLAIYIGMGFQVVQIMWSDRMEANEHRFPAFPREATHHSEFRSLRRLGPVPLDEYVLP